MSADDFRLLALSMPDAIEREHMGHPDFRANGRIFATLHSNDEFGMVKLTPEEQRVVIAADPEIFVPAAGAWGRQGCTNVRLRIAKVAPVRGAMLLAWEGTTRKPAAKRKSARRR